MLTTDSWGPFPESARYVRCDAFVVLGNYGYVKTCFTQTDGGGDADDSATNDQNATGPSVAGLRRCIRVGQSHPGGPFLV